MERHTHKPTSQTMRQRARMQFASVRAHGLHPTPVIASIEAPELPMVVQFEGLTKAEQRTALAAFPGGRRFVLQS